MATYTNIQDVARVIKASDKGLVRFSNSLTDLRASQGVGYDYSQIEYSPDFTGKKRLKFKFTSSNQFDVLEVDDRQNREFIISSSNDISDNWSAPMGLLTFNSQGWQGNFSDGSELTFYFDSHISDNEAELYIQEVEVEIDAVLAASQINFSSELLLNGRYYEDKNGLERPVPAVLSVAATYLSAYYIYSDTFLSILKEGGADQTYAGRWKKRAEKYITDFIKAEGYSPPNAVSFPRFIDKIGVPGEGPGMTGMVSDEADFDRSAENEEIFIKHHYEYNWPDFRGE